MSPGRKAEASSVRNWDDTVATANELASHREWVVWGVGPEAPSFLGGEPGNDIAEAIACNEDPAWTALGEHEKWVVTITGDEAGVLELLAESGSDMGYAPYLAPGKSEEMPDDYMKGRLRGDVAPRRKANQPRPYGG
jgi:hypothetical protein